jgi:hypothetical protein
MKKRAGELMAGDVIVSARLGRVVVDWVTLLPTGDYDVYYSRATRDGYGAVTVVEDAEFEVEA